jgi:hypothetical protein
MPTRPTARIVGQSLIPPPLQITTAIVLIAEEVFDTDVPVPNVAYMPSAALPPAHVEHPPTMAITRRGIRLERPAPEVAEPPGVAHLRQMSTAVNS